MHLLESSGRLNLCEFARHITDQSSYRLLEIGRKHSACSTWWWVSPSRLVKSIQNSPSARNPAPRAWRTQSKGVLLWAVALHRFIVPSVRPIGASSVVKLLAPSADLFALVFAKCSSLKLDNIVASETSPRKDAFPRPTIVLCDNSNVRGPWKSLEQTRNRRCRPVPQ